MPKSLNLKDAVHKSSRIKVAFFDIDGTIYRADHTVSKRTIDALSELKARGIKVCLASGRPYFGSLKLIKDLSITDACVLFSGALAIDPVTQRKIYSATLQPDEISELVGAINSNGLYLEYYSFDQYYVERTNHITEMHYTYLHKLPVTYPLDKIFEFGPFYKLVAISENELEAQKMRTIARQFPQFAHAFSTAASHPNLLFMNVTSTLASREKAFEVMLKHFSIAGDEVISFGDSEADLPFMNLSGIGVALENAPFDVKEKAPYLTSSVEEDGVAEALQILGLI